MKSWTDGKPQIAIWTDAWWSNCDGRPDRSPNPKLSRSSPATSTATVATTTTTTTTAVEPGIGSDESLVGSKSRTDIASKGDRGRVSPNFHTSTSAAVLRQAFHAAQGKRQAHYDTIEEVAHITEVTPWQQRTRFHAHLLGLKVDELEPAYKLPKRKSGEGDLLEVCESVERVLTKGMLRYDGSEERKLSTLIEKHLNTFRSVGTSQVGEVRPATTRKASDLHSPVYDLPHYITPK